MRTARPIDCVLDEARLHVRLIRFAYAASSLELEELFLAQPNAQDVARTFHLPRAGIQAVRNGVDGLDSLIEDYQTQCRCALPIAPEAPAIWH
jgi:hypothetical protein